MLNLLQIPRLLTLAEFWNCGMKNPKVNSFQRKSSIHFFSRFYSFRDFILSILFFLRFYSFRDFILFTISFFSRFHSFCDFILFAISWLFDDLMLDCFLIFHSIRYLQLYLSNANKSRKTDN